MSDYYYLHALSQQCIATKRASLPADVYVTACGGTKLVGQFASLFWAGGHALLCCSMATTPGVSVAMP